MQSFTRIKITESKLDLQETCGESSRIWGRKAICSWLCQGTADTVRDLHLLVACGVLPWDALGHGPTAPVSSCSAAEAPLAGPVPSLKAGCAPASTFSSCSSSSTRKQPVLEHSPASQGACKGSPGIVSSPFLFLFKRQPGEVLL